VTLERAAAHGAHVLTTVSEITASECEHLLGRKVDLTLPNGLNIERFVAMHEFQNMHREFKERIHHFVMGHFFSSYNFDLDRTLYFFTSGRYEYRNKGFDLTVEALAQLNYRLRATQSDRTVVVFFITKRPYRSINAEALRSRGVLEELRSTCDAIADQVRERLFEQTATGKTPRLDDLVDEYWKLRLRRTRAEWRIGRYPSIVSHDLVDDTSDELLNHLRSVNLINHPNDRVKVIYHPEFITPSNPLFGMDYDQFVRGCHMGIFPSYYEPWGYTPLECVARGIPAVTSDLSGFGAYVQSHVEGHEDDGIMVCPRRHTSFRDSAMKVADYLYDFTQYGRRERISLRNRIESSADRFDWHELVVHYNNAHQLAIERMS
jgi:glycogen(starch) synthase